MGLHLRCVLLFRFISLPTREARFYALGVLRCMRVLSFKIPFVAD